MPDLSSVSGRAPAAFAPEPVPPLATAGAGAGPAAVRTGKGRPLAVYLDHLASTPCDPDAAALMQRLAVEEFANPSSPHAAGQRAARRVERARRQLADAIGALPEEIVFTSGATESNNLVILGAAAAARERDDPRRRLLTLGIEHPSVLAPMAELGRRGWDLEHVPVGRDGRVDLSALEDALDGALLLSIQAANNEIGTIQPLQDASRLAVRRGVLVHSDAAQILGKAPFSVEELDLDFVSLSAHKCHGPKGVGALWVRNGPTRGPIRPLSFGGGHEQGLRPGTLNAPAIAGFGLAVEIGTRRLRADAARIAGLRDRLERGVRARLPQVRVNGAIRQRLPGASSLTFAGLDADALVANLGAFDLSTASACHAGAPEPSHVLLAIGLSRDDAYATLRLGLGRGTTERDVNAAVDRIVSAVRRQNRQEGTESHDNARTGRGGSSR